MNSKQIRFFLLGVFFLGLTVAAIADSQEDAAMGVIRRLLPDHAGNFRTELIDPQGQSDVFEIESINDKIYLRGSNGVAICSALNWYLKYYCNAGVSWRASQLNLPDPLPTISTKLRRFSPHKYRYFFNYCAFSYSMAWWDWPQWQQMIDWMALNGVNMPLAVTGQEAVWQKVYRKFGLTDKQISEFMVGPAYLPFGWMGCMDGWGGPLPQSWIDSHLELQKKILAHERSLGMTPVLQGFTGHVPTALKDKFPNAKFRQLPSWCQFPGTLFVDPTDPLFQQVGKAFVEEQTHTFGTDHLYASDTFIEMSPPSSEPKFLADMGRSVYHAMTAADPQAIWVMQGWIFFYNPNFWKPPQSKALLSAVPDDKMILLDLFCEWRPVWEKTEAFYGKPWLWCIIQNFGCTVSLHGGLPQITENLGKAMTSKDKGKMSGIGIIMEGLGYNSIVYDWMTDMTWRTEIPQLESWIGDYIQRRYGRNTPKAQRAWQLLIESVYRQPRKAGSTICLRPKLAANGRPARAGIPYDSEKLVDACRLLIECADELGEIDTFQYDLVHVLRQVLGNLSGQFLDRIGSAYQSRDQKKLQSACRQFLELLRDVDELLATRKEFLLGKWLADAKSWAQNDQQKRLYEWSARNQITLWGPEDSILHEYACKEWSGLIRGFYLRRWEKFQNHLKQTLDSNKPFSNETFEKEIRLWEEQWTHQTEVYPDRPIGNPVTVASRLWNKYHQLTTEPGY